MSYTYTYVLMDVSQACYREIHEKLLHAGYEQAIHASEDGKPVLDMHGIALRAAGADPLTPVQHKLYRFLCDHIDRRGYAPSIAEMCLEFGWPSLATAHKQLVALEEKGWVRRRPGGRRSLQIVGR